MSEFSLFTKRFFSLLDELDGQVSELGDLVQGVGGIVEDLAGLGGELSERREKALAARGLTSWSIRDPRLREMIEKFTILSHKKAAADIGGLTVEEGGRPGELTLF
jgi:hypothetical protein